MGFFKTHQESFIIASLGGSRRFDPPNTVAQDLMMWRSRMFWRLFGTFGVLLLATIAFLGIIVVNRVEQHFLQQIEESLEAKAILVRESLDGGPKDQTFTKNITFFS
jgi:hypothetical protein